MNDGVEGESDGFNLDFNKSAIHIGVSKETTHLEFKAYDWWWIHPESEKSIPHVIRYHQFLALLRIDAAEKIGLVRLPALEHSRFRRARIAQNLLRFSPASMYNLATQAWAGTGLYGVVDFFEDARQYRRALIDYFYDKDAFSSRQWFASDKGTINLNDLPRFVYKRASLWKNASRALVRSPAAIAAQRCVVSGDIRNLCQARDLGFSRQLTFQWKYKMIFHIVKRELYDHLSSLRFALTTLLILILMIVNAFAYLGEYKQKIKKYQENIADSRDRLKLHSDTLYRLALRGPGDLHKNRVHWLSVQTAGKNSCLDMCGVVPPDEDSPLEAWRCLISVHRNLAISIPTSKPRSHIHFASQIKHVEHHARLYQNRLGICDGCRVKLHGHPIYV